MAQLEFRSITKQFGTHVAVRQFDLTVGDGELVSFLGPSGCGKTTTLRIAAGFEAPTSGSVLLDGRDVTSSPPNRRGMGMVFQGYALFPNMNAADNIEFGLKVRARPEAERRRRVGHLLELFGLAHVAGSYPHQMSGGQQQRVALARAIAVEPSVLLLDEPLSAVDAKVREELRTEIRRMQADLGVTTILVTHDQAEALSISDRVVVMNRGLIEEVGTPARIYAEPRTAFTAAFIGAMNEIPVRVVDGRRRVVQRGLQRFAVTDITEVADGEAGMLLIRPELLVPLKPPTDSGQEPLIRGTVRVQTFLGATTRLLVDEIEERNGPVDGHDARAAAGEAHRPSGETLLRLAVDVSSSTAGRWPIGSDIALELAAGVTRVVPVRGAAGGWPAGTGTSVASPLPRTTVPV
jgi:putative spermidine/putrescine transport system ATP-binding protein